MKKYSVVIPVYNSNEGLPELCERLCNSLAGFNYEIVLVDDGSRDNSWEVLKKEKSKRPNEIRIIRLSRNFGQHNAISCGINASGGDFMITMDDDLQHPPEEIVKLIRCQESNDADLVYGLPENRKHGVVRIAGSYFVTKSSKLFHGNTEGSSFRLIKRELAQQIQRHQHKSMIYIDEILSWYTDNIHTTTVAHHTRKHGKSGYTSLSLIRLYFDIVFNHSAVPLKLMTRIGFIVSIICILLGVYFIIRKFIFNVPIGFTALIVTILFSASILMMCLGIVGQYLYKLFVLQNRKPSYFIRDQH